MDTATLLERIDRIAEVVQTTHCTMDEPGDEECPGCQAMRLLETLRLEIESEEETG